MASGIGTYDSAKSPKVWGMKRGVWKRMVEAIQWYTVRPIATARLPGRNSVTHASVIFEQSKKPDAKYQVTRSIAAPQYRLQRRGQRRV